MKTKLLLRIAAFLMLIHILGHTMGHSGWKQTTDPVKQEVIKQMTEHSFPFMGAMRSMGDFYDGYGYAATLTLLLVMALLWIISSASLQHKELTVKILPAVSLFLLAFGVNELIFFFLFAASISLLAGVLVLVSFFMVRKGQ